MHRGVSFPPNSSYVQEWGERLWDWIVPWTSLPCLCHDSVVSLGPCKGVSQDHLLPLGNCIRVPTCHLPPWDNEGDREGLSQGANPRKSSAQSLVPARGPLVPRPTHGPCMDIFPTTSMSLCHPCCWPLECVPPERRPVPRSPYLQLFPAMGS